MQILFSWNISRGGLLPNNFTMPNYHLQLPKLVTENVFLILGQMTTFGFGVFGKSNKNKITLVHHCSSLFCNFFTHDSNQNQIKSLLLSHHHSTSALVSEILESVLHTVQKKQKQFTYGQNLYLQTVQKTMCKKITYIYSVHTVYYKTYLVTNTPLYTFYIMYTSIHSNMWRCNRLYIIQYICATIQISCATDSCAKVQQIISYAMLVDVHCMVSSDSR